MPKFIFLKAMAIGKLKGVNEYTKALSGLIKEYPNSNVKNLAQEILINIAQGDYSFSIDTTQISQEHGLLAEQERIKQEKERAEQEEQEAKEKEIEIFTYDEKATHFYVIVVENRKTDINRLKFNVANFNIDYFSIIDFKVSAVLLNEEFQIVTVKSLEDKRQAMNYFRTIGKSSQIYDKLEQIKFRHFVISAENYPVFYKDKDIDKYLRFFEKFYVK